MHSEGHLIRSRLERSPLNIVHAGLDVLRSDLTDYMKSQDTASSYHVDDIESIGSPKSSNMPSPHYQRECEINNTSLQQESWQEISQNDVTCKQKMLAESMLDLLDDICESSEAAINILNDLLNYENMDAGESLSRIVVFAVFKKIFN